MSLAVLGIVLFLSVMAFWKPNVVLFMLAAGASMMLGLEWYNVFTTDIGLSIGLMFICYSFVLFGFGFRVIFWNGNRIEG